MKKRVLITGASRGIGRAIAKKLAAEGYDLVITCRERQKELLEVKSDCEALGADVYMFMGDLSDAAVIEQLFAELDFAKILPDILINNAGIAFVGLAQEMEPEEWYRLMDTNLTAPFMLCRKMIPLLLAKGGGAIVNISSVWGVVGASCEAAYSAAKGGLNALTKALAKELAPSGIPVNAIACGAIDTEMNSHLSAEELAALAEEIPAGRLGRPEEVAESVFALINSPAYLTGQIITLDGGWT